MQQVPTGSWFCPACQHCRAICCQGCASPANDEAMILCDSCDQGALCADRQTDRRTDGQTDGRTDGRTDTPRSCAKYMRDVRAYPACTDVFSQLHSEHKTVQCRLCSWHMRENENALRDATVSAKSCSNELCMHCKSGSSHSCSHVPPT